MVFLTEAWVRVEVSLSKSHKSWALEGGQQTSSRDWPKHALQKGAAPAQRTQGSLLEEQTRAQTEVPRRLFLLLQPASLPPRGSQDSAG